MSGRKVKLEGWTRGYELDSSGQYRRYDRPYNFPESYGEFCKRLAKWNNPVVPVEVLIAFCEVQRDVGI